VADPGRILAIDYGTRGWAGHDRSPADHRPGGGDARERGDIPARIAALVSSRG